MAFRDFVYPDVRHDLGLTLTETDLFGNIPPLEPSQGFLERMRVDVKLGLGIGTEKARSEFIIAPVLAELRRLLDGAFGLFSGIEFDVDPARGLNGYCDFILTREPLLTELTAPIIAIAEAKNDNLRNGYGQCVAAMVAARDFNAKAGTAIATVYGVVTTGSAWKFLQLVANALTLDKYEYSHTELGRILGILAHFVRSH